MSVRLPLPLFPDSMMLPYFQAPLKITVSIDWFTIKAKDFAFAYSNDSISTQGLSSGSDKEIFLSLCNVMHYIKVYNEKNVENKTFA